jgi:sulfur relay (sulfurtransferase) DsrF/TusC family protein
MPGREFRLGLLVKSGPYVGRESRAELDMALAAASLDFTVEVYFLGDAVLQLANNKSGNTAQLPAGHRGWSALPGLGEVEIFAESAWLRRCERLGVELVLPAEGVGFARMKQNWRRCDQVVVI